VHARKDLVKNASYYSVCALHIHSKESVPALCLWWFIWTQN